MRTIACKTVWALLVGVSLVLSLNSCSKDPVIPRYRRPEVPTKIRNPRPDI